MANNNRPKLELTSESVKVKLLKDKPYEGRNGIGDYFLYTVSHEGTEKAYFATLDIHRLIQENRLKSGSEFILTKHGKSVELTLLSTVQTEDKATGDDKFREMMELCLRDAVAITKAVSEIPFQNEDVRAVANALFIARSRAA